MDKDYLIQKWLARELTPEEEKLLEDWDRRKSAVTGGRRKKQKAILREERTVGLKELMFVMESDPYFNSVRMNTTLKSGFVGRGVSGEPRNVIREK